MLLLMYIKANDLIDLLKFILHSYTLLFFIVFVSFLEGVWDSLTEYYHNLQIEIVWLLSMCVSF